MILPNSWKSALVPFMAHIPRRTGYVGEMRWGLVNDARRLDKKGMPRLVDRYAALAAPRGEAPAAASPPVLVADNANRAAAVSALGLDLGRSVAMLCPGAEFGPQSAGPPSSSRSLRADSWPTASACG